MNSPIFHLTSPEPDDWSWMARIHAETAHDSLPPIRRDRITVEQIQKGLVSQVLAMQTVGTLAHEAIIARDEQGNRAGFIWVEEVVSNFTGEKLAYISEVYVVENYRRHGLGRMLLDAADKWARERGLHRIALNVSAYNDPARKLYESSDYQAETVRMAKELKDA